MNVKALFANKKLLIIVAAVLLLVVGGAGAFLMKGKKKPATKAVAAAKTTAGEIAEDAKGGEAKAEGAKEGEAKGGEGGEGKEGAAAPAPPTKKSLTYQFDKNFTVNLMDPKGRWFVTTSIQVEMASAKARDEIEEKVPPLRDATIMLLSSKTREEVLTRDGKERLKRELLARFEGILEPKAIKNIYFNDFMVVMR